MSMIKKISMAAALFLSTAVQAAPEKSQAFQDAAATWLANDDAGSLPVLSELAKGGDVHAQILLGQIDRDTVAGGASPYVLGLTRAERRDLLRNPKGEGRTSNWLLSLSDPSLAEHGETLFNYRVGLDPVGSMVGLDEHGEAAAAQFLVWFTMDQGRFDKTNQIPATSTGLVEAGAIKWLRGFMSSDSKLMNTSMFLADESEDKVQGLLALDRLSWVLGLQDSISDEMHDLIHVLRGAPGLVSDTSNPLELNENLKEVSKVDVSLGLLDRVCSACPESDADPYCLSQSLDMLGGYRTLISVRTPSEAVISAEEFYSSDRSVATLSQVLRSMSTRYAPEIKSTCLKAMFATN